MRCPGHHHLGTRGLLILLYRDDISESLHRMHRRRFHADNRHPGIFPEPFQHRLGIVVSPVFQTSERADADNVAIASYHAGRLLDVFRLVAVHHHPELGFNLPTFIIDIENDRIHSQIRGRFLRTQSGAQA